MRWFVVTFTLDGFERPMSATVYAVDEIDAAANIQQRHPKCIVTTVTVAEHVTAA